MSPDDFHIVRHKLESTLPGSKRKMNSAFDALATVIGLARACGITRKIVFRPSLSRNAEVNYSRSNVVKADSSSSEGGSCLNVYDVVSSAN